MAATSRPAAAAGRVRPAAPRDLDRVAALWTSITTHHEPLDPAFHVRPGSDRELRLLLEATARDADAAILLWEDAGDGAVPDQPGMCIVRIQRAPELLAERGRAEITDLAVRPDRRRRGIGRALAQAALEWVAARGVERVEVRVAHANREGQAFWRALGFADLVDVLHRRL